MEYNTTENLSVINLVNVTKIDEDDIYIPVKSFLMSKIGK